MAHDTYNVRQETARTVNEELKAIEANAFRLQREIERLPKGDARRLAKEAKLATLQEKLDAAIVAAKAGRVWLHRSKVDRFNHGQRTRGNMAPIWSVTNK